MSEQPSKPRIHPLTVWVPIIIAVLGLVVFEAYLLRLKEEKMRDRSTADGGENRLPVLSRLEKNLALTERSGKTVELKDLKGKVMVACYVYTHCPRSCPGVVAQMNTLFKEVGSDPNVHFLSFSVEPDDSPEILTDFTKRFGITGDNWWFLNGPKDELRVYLTRYFGFYAVQDVPEKDRFSPEDKYLHDAKVVLVDHKGQVRGKYDIGSPDPEFAKDDQRRIREDIKTILEERAKDQPNP
jgi:cytochrome oxidase Cu insertion factor (SCO1/SenC/PrrC family)